jgi:hypothetical protein
MFGEVVPTPTGFSRQVKPHACFGWSTGANHKDFTGKKDAADALVPRSDDDGLGEA